MISLLRKLKSPNPKFNWKGTNYNKDITINSEGCISYIFGNPFRLDRSSPLITKKEVKLANNSYLLISYEIGGLLLFAEVYTL